MSTDIAKKIRRDGDIKLRRDLEKLDEPVKSDLWRNLHFFKDGKTHLGANIGTFEEVAAIARETLVFVADTTISMHHFTISNLIFRKTDYSHAIQIPVKP